MQNEYKAKLCVKLFIVACECTILIFFLDSFKVSYNCCFSFSIFKLSTSIMLLLSIKKKLVHIFYKQYQHGTISKKI